MFDFRTGLGASVVLALVGSAHAQQFAHHIGENNPDSFIGEEIEDMTLLVNAAKEFKEIALSGSRSFIGTFFGVNGLVVITDDAGHPLRAWSIDFFGSGFETASAIRQSVFDNDLLVLELTDQDNTNDLNEAVVLRMDEQTGAPVYAWRYQASPAFNEWGMEVEGEDAVFAGAVRPDNGLSREGLLVRFSQANGLPSVNNRYQPFQFDQDDLRFNDVAIDPQQNAIFATGAIEILGKDGSPQGSKLVVARFNPLGAVAWIRAYNTFLQGEEFRAAEGWSIEVTSEGNVAAVSNSFGDFGDGVLALLVEPAGGGPLASNFLRMQEVLRPAYNSLELQENDRLLASGTRLSGDGDGRAVMWSMDPSTLSVDWFFQDDTGQGLGCDAIVQPNTGLLLAGTTFPFNFPVFSNSTDALLIRTDRLGQGPCSFDDPPVELPTSAERIDVPVEVIQMPTPFPEQPDIRTLAERFEEICEQVNDCVGDFDGDGDVDLGDFGVFGAAFGSMLGDANYNPAADFDMDGDVDLGDFGVFGAEFGRTDCL